MARVTKIPATLSQFTSANISEVRKRRVAAYARVSTDHDDQVSSYEAQVDFYTNYIKSREDWEFVAIYADEGISGTSTKHREGFNRMIKDALAGRIDLIITKSVSRFARNTVDSLSTIRKLKEIGCECYFEKENIWTFDGKGELLITIMSSLAQEESRSISENVTWGQRKRFQDGKVTVPFGRFLGYDRGEDGNLVINEEQAKIVRRIYAMFIQGFSPFVIARELAADGIPTPSGNGKWCAGTVKSILSNEKYKGDALLQKSFVVDYLTKKIKPNEGEIPQYYVTGNHEPIIPPATFDMVQRMLAVRTKGKNRRSGVSIFSSRIKCGDCGSWYGSKVWHSNDKYRKIVWQCNHKFEGEKCTTPTLEEDDIKQMFVKAANAVITEKTEIIVAFEEIKDTLFSTADLETERTELETELNVMAELLQKAITENARVALDQDEYTARYTELSDRFEQAKARLDEVTDAITMKTAKREQIELYLAELAKADLLSEFSEDVWLSMVDYITVYGVDNIVFHFKDGTEIKTE